MAECAFCSDTLLRHIRSGQSYWFCRRCRVEFRSKDMEKKLNPYQESPEIEQSLLEVAPSPLQTSSSKS
jgi:ribosomal protein L37AE/L43A